MVDTLTRKGFVYAFGGGGADGDASMKDLLGGKGANLAEMSSLGLPVPPGFTITTEACTFSTPTSGAIRRVWRARWPKRCRASRP